MRHQYKIIQWVAECRNMTPTWRMAIYNHHDDIWLTIQRISEVLRGNELQLTIVRPQIRNVSWILNNGLLLKSVEKIFV